MRLSTERKDAPQTAVNTSTSCSTSLSKRRSPTSEVDVSCIVVVRKLGKVFDRFSYYKDFTNKKMMIIITHNLNKWNRDTKVAS